MNTISLEKYNDEYRVLIGEQSSNPISTIQLPQSTIDFIKYRIQAQMFYIINMGRNPESDNDARYLFKYIIEQYTGKIV